MHLKGGDAPRSVYLDNGAVSTHSISLETNVKALGIASQPEGTRGGAIEGSD